MDSTDRPDGCRCPDLAKATASFHHSLLAEDVAPDTAAMLTMSWLQAIVSAGMTNTDDA